MSHEKVTGLVFFIRSLKTAKSPAPIENLPNWSSPLAGEEFRAVRRAVDGFSCCFLGRFPILYASVIPTFPPIAR